MMKLMIRLKDVKQEYVRYVNTILCRNTKDISSLVILATLVIEFPVASGAKITSDEISVKEQFDTYFSFQKHYTAHNSSNTLS